MLCRRQLAHVRGAQATAMLGSLTPLENGRQLWVWGDFAWQSVRGEKASTTELQQ